jgi:hypothetical protein
MLKVPVGATPVDRHSLDDALKELEKAVSASKGPLRIVVRDDQTSAAIQRMLAAKPGLNATTVLIPKQ